MSQTPPVEWNGDPEIKIRVSRRTKDGREASCTRRILYAEYVQSPHLRAARLAAQTEWAVHVVNRLDGEVPSDWRVKWASLRA